jgi:uncharacterized circularly permuted ATP-grasp superfamily protein
MPKLKDVADVFDGYRLSEPSDETLASPGQPRAADDAPLSLSVDPGVIDAAEWDLVSRGVRQRVRVLEAFLTDVYGLGRAFDDGVVPWRLLYTAGRFRREAAGFTPPNGVRCHVSVIDLIRDEQGRFRVLEDNVRIPSGVSRDEYPSRLLSALRAAAPHGVTDPFIVVLTPGGRDATSFECALLARLMGVKLVEGKDLVCWRNRMYMRTDHGRRPVDVIYRGVDDDWLDPLQFRPESPIACPGLVNAARAGNVTIANAIGNGVADDKISYPYIPDLTRYYLGEEPLLENVASRRHHPEGAPGHIGLRTIAVNDGGDVWVLPGIARKVARNVAREVAPGRDG